MSNLSIKDVPESWAQTLRKRAARNHRSLQGELLSLIEAAVQEPGLPLQGGAQPQPTEGQRMGWKTVTQVVAELNTKHPNPELHQALPRGVDIIREDRASR